MSCTRDDGFARLPTGRAGTQPVGGFAGRTLVFGLHIHAPGEDAADLEQPQLLSFSVPLGEVTEQLALIVGNEAALYPAFCIDLSHGVPGPWIVAPVREIRRAGALGQEEDAGQARLIPAVESIDEGDHEPGHLPRVATVWKRGVVAGDDHPCRLLVNYRF